MNKATTISLKLNSWLWIEIESKGPRNQYVKTYRLRKFMYDSRIINEKKVNGYSTELKYTETLWHLKS